MDDPGNGWYHIESNGQHPHIVLDRKTGKTKTISLVIDDEVIKRVVANGVPEAGVLVDKDHLSWEEDHDTEAMSWCKDLAGFYDAMGVLQLAGWQDWTAVGFPLIKGKVYKHFSTEYQYTDEDVSSGELRPSRLTGLAITNRPANGGQRPITSSVCRRGRRTLKSGEVPEKREDVKTQNETIDMELLAKLAALLGMPEGSTEEEALAEVSTLLKVEEKAEDAEIDTLISSEGLGDLADEEKSALKETLKSNRKAGETLIKTLKSRASGVKPGARYASAQGAHAGTRVMRSRAATMGRLGLVDRAKAYQSEMAKSGTPVSYQKAFRKVSYDDANGK